MKFTGIAYWGGSLPEGWQSKVASVLAPAQSTLAVAITDEGLWLTTADEKLCIKANSEGRTSGVVPASPAGPLFLLALVALRRAFGTLRLVDDAQADIPTMVRSNYPLFADCWSDLNDVAEQLGLVVGQQFLSRYGSVLARIF